jgi:Ca-activated chloride channel family protein
VPKPAATSTKPTAVIVLMSDGTPTIGDGTLDPVAAAEAAATDAKQANVPVDTIAFGTSGGSVNVQGQDVAVPYDPQSMAAIAQASGGKTFTAQSAGQLGSIYDQIGRTVAYVVHTRELTAAFAGLALLLALAAAGAALVWTQRLV